MNISNHHNIFHQKFLKINFEKEFIVLDGFMVLLKRPEMI